MQKEEYKCKRKDGISLIVLSITILVMAILAATAIIALEDTGVIGRSKSTVSKQNYTQEYERLQVIKNGVLTDNLGTITVAEYITELRNKGLIEEGETTNDDNSKTVTTKTGFTLNIKQDGESNLILSLGESNSTIALSPTTLSADITDGTVTKTITATTSNVSGNINWTTSNASVATVTGTNSSATVTVKGVGTATITATYGAAKASCTVTVTEPEPSTVSITSMSITPTVVYPGENTFTFVTEVEKSEADEELTFKYTFYDSNWIDIYTTEKTDTILDEFTVATTSSSIDTSGTINLNTLTPVYVTLTITDASGTQKAICDLDYTIGITCLPAGTLITVEVEEEDENGKKRKRRKKKRIEDLTYDDDLVVWDFDNACFTTAKPLWLTVRGEAEEYNLLKFSDGSELKTVRQHRIFNKELGKFTYPMTDETPIGTTTFNELGEEVTLVSKEVVEEKVSYYNIISHYHMNTFAEGILTSCRFSNLYEIKDMKYVKDNRELVSIEEYKDIPEEYFYGLRVAEQPKEVNRGNDDSHAASIKDHIRMYISRSKKR